MRPRWRSSIFEISKAKRGLSHAIHNFTTILMRVLAAAVMADDEQDLPKAAEEVSVTEVDSEKQFADFGSLFEKSAMIGTFTIDGDEQQRVRAERYEISKVVKQAQGDYWMFFARIKYGDHDVTLPVPVEVKWAAKTPVITVDNLTIPGMGTFDARVLISDNKYAGTWRHGKVGGLMYGRIEKQEGQEKEVQAESN